MSRLSMEQSRAAFALQCVKTLACQDSPGEYRSFVERLPMQFAVNGCLAVLLHNVDETPAPINHLVAWLTVHQPFPVAAGDLTELTSFIARCSHERLCQLQAECVAFSQWQKRWAQALLAKSSAGAQNA